jgi:tetratricopeptide (TPR) repeat protein
MSDWVRGDRRQCSCKEKPVRERTFPADFQQSTLAMRPEVEKIMRDRSQGDQDQAMADCDRAIALGPAFAPAYANRGYIYLDKGEVRRALAEYGQAVNSTQVRPCGI